MHINGGEGKFTCPKIDENNPKEVTEALLNDAKKFVITEALRVLRAIGK